VIVVDLTAELMLKGLAVSTHYYCKEGEISFEWFALARRDNAYLLKMSVYIFRQLPEQHPEQSRQQRTRQIQPFRTKVISIVQLSSSQRRQQ